MSNPFDYLRQESERRAKRKSEMEEAVRKAREDLEKTVEVGAQHWDPAVRRLLTALQDAAYRNPERVYRIEYQAARAETDAHMLRRGNVFRRHALWRFEERIREDPEEWRSILQVRLRVDARGRAEGFTCERFDRHVDGPVEAPLNEKALQNALKKLYPPGSVA